MDNRVTIKLDKEEAERLEDTNIPQEVIETAYERHKDLLENGIQRDSVVSKRKVPINVGRFVVWGEWK